MLLLLLLLSQVMLMLDKFFHGALQEADVLLDGEQRLKALGERLRQQLDLMLLQLHSHIVLARGLGLPQIISHSRRRRHRRRRLQKVRTATVHPALLLLQGRSLVQNPNLHLQLIHLTLQYLDLSSSRRSRLEGKPRKRVVGGEGPLAQAAMMVGGHHGPNTVDKAPVQPSA